MSEPNWKATVVYRTENGPVGTEYLLEELYDLHDFVERGPHWDTIEKIEVVRVNHNESEDLTVEKAQTL